MHDLVRRAGNISVHVIAGDNAAQPTSTRLMVTTDATQPFDSTPYIFALTAVAAALVVSLAATSLLGLNVDLIFLAAVVGIAVRYGLWPSLVAAAAASLCYNFFFLPPIYTFTIADPANIAAFLFFTVLAVLISRLAARGWSHTVAAQERVRVVETLYAFSRKLAGVVALDDVLWAAAYQIALMLKVRVVLLLPDKGSIAVRSRLSARRHARRGRPRRRKVGVGKRPTGRTRFRYACPAPSGFSCRCAPVAGPSALSASTATGQARCSGPIERRLLDALVDQGALAIERVHLVEDIDRAKRTAETDRLRSALLTSISHDLKTPLAGILGSAGALRDLSESFDAAGKADLLATIIDESERLNRFIANLLDMTKLESGAVLPNVAPHDIGEIVGSALERASRILAGHRVEVEISPNLPMVMIDAVLFEQALFNLLDNAAKYAPPTTTISILSWQDAGMVSCRSSTRATAFPPVTWSGSSTSSTECGKGTRCAPVPAWGSRSLAVSSRP